MSPSESSRGGIASATAGPITQVSSVVGVRPVLGGVALGASLAHVTSISTFAVESLTLPEGLPLVTTPVLMLAAGAGVWLGRRHALMAFVAGVTMLVPVLLVAMLGLHWGSLSEPSLRDILVIGASKPTLPVIAATLVAPVVLGWMQPRER